MTALSDRKKPETDVTVLLRSWRSGDQEALERLAPVVYDELRRLARLHLRKERKGHTLDATGLVNEAFVKLIGLDQMEFQDRQHFFAMASRVMRRVLVDHARGQIAQKRGGAERPLTLDRIAPEGLVDVAAGKGTDLLDLDRALEALEATDERACRIVEMRYFGGLTHEEVASVLDVSHTTVRRDWAFARAFLKRELQG